ncbi:MAG: tetratricopeptide repeat protein [Acidobacteria bacterium]|nr:tetratricopeptide repeat protein [Acidobacteriota bacterium]
MNKKDRSIPPACVRQMAALLILAALTLAAFWNTLDNDFVLYDDNVYVTTNRHVQQGVTPAGLQWAFTTTHGANWHPLTWMSHMLDCELFGLNPRGHHLTSLLLHLANTLLLFAALQGVTGALWRSAFVAALFAVHPMHVESVAWIAERKDVLSTLFWMLTLLAYIRYVQRPAPKRYLWVAVIFALGLMAKPMLVTLPLLLLLLDYWPLQRLKSDFHKGQRKPLPVGPLIVEKVPLFALAAASSMMTLYAQSSGQAVRTLQEIPFGSRLANAIASYVQYVTKMFWPRNLAAFYPHPGNVLPAWQVALALAFLIGITALCIRWARARPYLLVGWLWYVVALLPVIGIVQVGDQAMADRYSYVPLVGLFVIVVWGTADMLPKWLNRGVLPATVAAAAVLLLALQSGSQVGTWRDSFTLFDHARRVVDGNYLAHNNLGFLFARQGKLDAAIEQYREALRFRPRYAHAHNNLGAALAALGRGDQAMVHYAAALEILPDYVEARVNVGIELAARGEMEQAVRHFSQALRLNPDDPKAHYNFGLVLAGLGRVDQAVEHYRSALENRPDYAEAYVALGVLLAQQGRLDDAVTQYQRALQIRPDYADAHINLGIELAQQNRVDQALGHFAEAARIHPASAEAHFNLARAYLLLGDGRRAQQEYSILRGLNPALAEELRRTMELSGTGGR